MKVEAEVNMSFHDWVLQFKRVNIENFFIGVTDKEINSVLNAEVISVEQFYTLLSPIAEKYLEEMAQLAHNLTVQNFGKTIQLYTPIYISNYCVNNCIYCGFNINSKIRRKQLTLKEVDKEANFISSTGLRHILILTGESRKENSLFYIKDCIKILKKYFTSISIEIYALKGSEYEELIKDGVDGLTIYQEVYDEVIYDKVHLAGPKKDYLYRLEAPERALAKGMRCVNIGTLLGLNDWRKEAFMLGIHAKFLQDNFSDAEISVSIPRIRKTAGGFKPVYNVTDTNVAQIIMAFRIFLPRLGITLSTRESPEFRENLIPLGITRISAGSTTVVGGHTISEVGSAFSEQFKILDERSVSDVKVMLEQKGYQSILKDWVGV